jgi:hypothetical protein
MTSDEAPRNGAAPRPDHVEYIRDGQWVVALLMREGADPIAFAAVHHSMLGVAPRNRLAFELLAESFGAQIAAFATVEAVPPTQV